MAPPINLSPLDDDEDDLKIPAPLPGGDAEDITPPDLAVAPPVHAAAAAPAEDTFEVIARSGLNVRSGPGTAFPVIGSLPLGARVHLLKREDAWALIDQEGDGAADGHVLSSFLKGVQQSGSVVGPTPAAVPPAAPTSSLYEPLTLAALHAIMDRCAGLHIVSKLDLNQTVDALNRAMVLAKATTRLREMAFLSQAVIETDFFRTYGEYGEGKGKSYFPYYGRGIHQLTWKGTYAACSHAMFNDDRLVRNPNLILDDIETNIKATAWYWRDSKPFNKLADAGDIDAVIHLLYGGTIHSSKASVRESVMRRRSYYTTIGKIIV